MPFRQSVRITLLITSKCRKSRLPRSSVPCQRQGLCRSASTGSPDEVRRLLRVVLLKSDENMVSFPRVYPPRLVLFPLCNFWCSFGPGRLIEDMLVSMAEPLDRLSPDD